MQCKYECNFYNKPKEFLLQCSTLLSSFHKKDGLHNKNHNKKKIYENNKPDYHQQLTNRVANAVHILEIIIDGKRKGDKECTHRL